MITIYLYQLILQNSYTVTLNKWVVEHVFLQDTLIVNEYMFYIAKWHRGLPTTSITITMITISHINYLFNCFSYLLEWLELDIRTFLPSLSNQLSISLFSLYLTNLCTQIICLYWLVMDILETAQVTMGWFDSSGGGESSFSTNMGEVYIWQRPNFSCNRYWIPLLTQIGTNIIYINENLNIICSHIILTSNLVVNSV